MYKHLNPNPSKLRIDDCVVRAISISTGHSWDYTFLSLSIHAFDMKGMSSTNFVWDDYLRDIGYDRHDFVKNKYKRMTIREFCELNPIGNYILATGTHVVAAIDGVYYDTWDSGDEIVLYLYERSDVNDNK